MLVSHSCFCSFFTSHPYIYILSKYLQYVLLVLLKFPATVTSPLSHGGGVGGGGGGEGESDIDRCIFMYGGSTLALALKMFSIHTAKSNYPFLLSTE